MKTLISYFLHRTSTAGKRFLSVGVQVKILTLIGAICMGLVAVVPTVIISITCPVIWDAAATVTLELSARTGVTTSCLITVVAAVVI